jgi:hypothetical protein
MAETQPCFRVYSLGLNVFLQQDLTILFFLPHESIAERSRVTVLVIELSLSMCIMINFISTYIKFVDIKCFYKITSSLLLAKYFTILKIHVTISAMY